MEQPTHHTRKFGDLSEAENNAYCRSILRGLPETQRQQLFHEHRAWSAEKEERKYSGGHVGQPAHGLLRTPGPAPWVDNPVVLYDGMGVSRTLEEHKM